MKLLTKSIREKLLANGRTQEPVRGTNDEIDFRPAVKLFTPDADDGCELFFRVRSDVGPGILICAA